MTLPIQITRHERDADGLRRAARRAPSIVAAQRMLAPAMVLEGASRTEAATAAGMDRQTLRDWVHRYHEEGLPGLADRQGAVGPKRLLSPEREAEVAEWVRRGPDLAEHGVGRWRRADLAREIERKFGVVLAERTMSTVLRRLGFRRLVARPRHPGPAIPAMTRRHKRLSGRLRRPRKGGPAGARTRQAVRSVVAGRSQDRSAGHPGAGVG